MTEARLGWRQRIESRGFSSQQQIDLSGLHATKFQAALQLHQACWPTTQDLWKPSSRLDPTWSSLSHQYIDTYVHIANRRINSYYRCTCRSQWSNVIWCQKVGLGALPWTYVLVQPMRETPPLQPGGQKDVNGSNAEPWPIDPLFPPDPRHLAPRKELCYTDTEGKGLDEKSKWNAWSYSFWLLRAHETLKETRRLRNSETATHLLVW